MHAGGCCGSAACSTLALIFFLSLALTCVPGEQISVQATTSAAAAAHGLRERWILKNLFLSRPREARRGFFVSVMMRREV